MMQENSEKLTSKSTGYRAILKNRNFLWLWLGQVFSQLGDRVTFVIFVAVIARVFYTSTTLQSWLYVAFTIPAILLTTIAGVFIDKWNKKTVLISTNILRAVFILFLPAFSHTLFGIYFLAFLISSVTQFFVPAEASSIPTLVKRHQLLTANSLFTTTMMGSIIFGFALGDPLINIFGFNFVHYAVAGLFVISALFLALIKYPISEFEQVPHKTFGEFLDELKQGFVYIKDHPPVMQAIAKLAALFSIIVMLSILSIGISQKSLYPYNPALGAQKFVYIIAFSGVGMVFGSIMVGKFWRDINKYFLTYSGFTLIAINLILLTLIPLIPNQLYIQLPEFKTSSLFLESFRLTFRMIYTYAVAGTIGFGSALVAIPVQTIMHSLVPEDVRGKVFGVQFTMLSTSSTMPVLVAAFGADAIGLTSMLLVIAIPVLLLGIYGLLVKSKTKITS